MRPPYVSHAPFTEWVLAASDLPSKGGRSASLPKKNNQIWHYTTDGKTLNCTPQECAKSLPLETSYRLTLQIYIKRTQK
jgi:hypothetical protein